MQPLTDEQAALLVADSIETDLGLELLTPGLAVVEDISADVEHTGEIKRGMHDSPHGTCSLRLTRELRWGVDLVRPYMRVTDLVTGATSRWSLGVYTLTTPRRVTGETPPIFDVEGSDRVQLLYRQAAQEVTVLGGTTYRKALLDVFALAGVTGVLIDGAAADDLLPATRVWSLVGRSTDPDQTDTPVTWLRIVNDLLAAINFRAVWADENGLYRCGAYRPPVDRQPEFTFDTDRRTTIVGETTVETLDVWATPNRWVFRQTNRPAGAPVATLGDGLHQIDLPDQHPLSAASRGLVWPSVVDYEAATQAKLVELAERRVARDLQRSATLEVTTGPFPCAGHFDVFTLIDDSGSRKVQAVEWAMPLDGSDMTWTWEVV